MTAVETLGLHANQWQFLNAPDRYVAASSDSGGNLALASTRRQFLTARDILARLNGSHGIEARHGILLADDVGLGKTTVAALVAWVVACAGKRVRILAPNDVMARRWVEEIRAHVPLLRKCAPRLEADARRVKAGRVRRLTAGTIQVAKHSYAATDSVLDCDLLIVDEAHRAKGEGSVFAQNLHKNRKNFGRVLILTATPFSIDLLELTRMLAMIDGQSASAPVKKFSNALDNLYSGSTTRNLDGVAERLAETAEAATAALGAFVIRHGVEDLPNERAAFGSVADWCIPVPSASAMEIELMLRFDRALRVAKDHNADAVRATNDPRFHVGWGHFDDVRGQLRSEVQTLPEPARAVVDHQLRVIGRLRGKGRAHTKMVAVGEAVRCVVEQGEKVVLFCHHHATARELTAHLASVLPEAQSKVGPDAADWQVAWEQLIRKIGTVKEPIRNEARLRINFIAWLCSEQIRTKTWAWVTLTAKAPKNLVHALDRVRPRHGNGPETIAAAAQRLYEKLIGSPSSSRILLDPGEDLERLPSGNSASRVLGICERKPTDNLLEQALFLHNQQPDTAISIFNSPFGPDVLIATDRLSEGIDLHRYCRHLIHYELGPSPMRIVQRNGRLRRLNNWAAVTGKPILVAYPAFGGTRDHRVVQIMKKRIGSFSLLLGGVRDIESENGADTDKDEDWRNQVVSKAKFRLKRAGGQLCSKNPSDSV